MVLAATDAGELPLETSDGNDDGVVEDDVLSCATDDGGAW